MARKLQGCAAEAHVEVSGALITALQNQARGVQPLPPTVSQSELIRKLSVFVSDLEWVARPGDGNYDLCKRAHKAFSDILDEVLDVRPLQGSSNVELFEDREFDALAPMNITDWIENMDWAATTDQWAF
ncbi:MAG: hypothetical protein M1818_001254 [Claussenomyces sp. TS43310]|nr:MAG: hypothetical protein M1818_001254 [Claussenomyces sp. TS43310]